MRVYSILFASACISAVTFSLPSGFANGKANSFNNPEERVVKFDLSLLPAIVKAEMGSFKPGKQYKLILEISNLTGMPLVVEDVKTSCGCMRSGGKTGNAIENSERGRLDLMFTAPKRSGKFLKQVSIVFAGMPKGPANIKLFGEVESVIHLETKRIGVDESGVAQFGFTIDSETQLTPVSVRSKNGTMSSMSLSNKGKGNWGVSCSSVKTELLQGEISDVFTFTLQPLKDSRESYPDEIEVEQQVLIAFPKGISIIPSEVFAGKEPIRLIVLGHDGDLSDLRFREESSEETLHILSSRKIKDGWVISVQSPKFYLGIRRFELSLKGKGAASAKLVIYSGTED